MAAAADASGCRRGTEIAQKHLRKPDNPRKVGFRKTRRANGRQENGDASDASNRSGEFTAVGVIAGRRHGAGGSFRILLYMDQDMNTLFRR
jgi:hypothetical protein